MSFEFQSKQPSTGIKWLRETLTHLIHNRVPHKYIDVPILYFLYSTYISKVQLNISHSWNTSECVVSVRTTKLCINHLETIRKFWPIHNSPMWLLLFTSPIILQVTTWLELRVDMLTSWQQIVCKMTHIQYDMAFSVNAHIHFLVQQHRVWVSCIE